MEKTPKIITLPNQPKQVKVSEDIGKAKERKPRGTGAAIKGNKTRGPMA